MIVIDDDDDDDDVIPGSLASCRERVTVVRSKIPGDS
jgi:hypothetical protein